MPYKEIVLLPNLLDESLSSEGLLPLVRAEVESIEGLIAESFAGAKRYLRRFLPLERVNAIPIYLLNEHTKQEELAHLKSLVEQGKKWGIVSDAGMPCLADPGAALVMHAHAKNIFVRIIPGPSSVFLALALSGFSGQKFSFHGYLPREKQALEKTLRELEKISYTAAAPQIWIEAPYRTEKMIRACVEILSHETFLCVAAELTMSEELVETLRIEEWKKRTISEFNKKRAVFLLQKFK
ncbi:MAG: SAM-dependent methyltransferase [Parachlamydiales bacterium]|nr:SAM-dependent methyltransferase [Parachlamydiales bacterium]